MASTNIDKTGNITVTLDLRERQLAVMLQEELGADVFTQVFNLWFEQRVRDVMNTRFTRLSPQDQADLMTKIASAKSLEGLPLASP